MEPNSPQTNPAPNPNGDQNSNGIAGKPLYPTAKASSNVYESLEAANVMPEFLPKEAPEVTVEALHKNNPLQNVRTYEGDVAQLMKNKGGSMSKIFAAQQKKKQTDHLAEIRRLQAEAEERQRKEDSDRMVTEQKVAEKVVAQHVMQPEQIPGRVEHTGGPIPDFSSQPIQEKHIVEEEMPVESKTKAAPDIQHLASQPGIIPSTPSEAPYGERSVWKTPEFVPPPAPKNAPMPEPVQEPAPEPAPIQEETKPRQHVVMITPENPKEEAVIRDVNDDPKKSLYILGLSGLLILAGALALGIFFLVVKNRVAETTQPLAVMQEVIATDQTVVATISTSTEKTLQGIFWEQKDGLEGKDGTVVKIDFKETLNGATKSIGGQQFAAMLGTQMPSWLIRSISPSYVAGFHYHNSWEPFIIFKTTSFDNAYAGMLSWEGTMKDDLSALMPALSDVATSTARATSTTTKNAGLGPFRDVIIRNKDARELVNIRGQMVLVYSIPDKETIVITTNETTLRELLTRLTTSKFVR